MLFGLTSELLHEFRLKAENCRLDKPLAFPIPRKMGCSHLPNGTRQLLNSSIISKQQLGTGRKASLSRETTRQLQGPVLWCKKLRKARVQAQTQHLYYNSI